MGSQAKNIFRSFAVIPRNKQPFLYYGYLLAKVYTVFALDGSVTLTGKRVATSDVVVVQGFQRDGVVGLARVVVLVDLVVVVDVVDISSRTLGDR